ncbi:hypothetical protein [Saccharopolyspora pogona]|uniref:hypothetical protein n=1 Tax=Saccharopolyspora pogona TaxID=333966 RepID=UPI001689A237|nr:hypothetical protein [Saccharopolyspora pogona]
MLGRQHRQFVDVGSAAGVTASAWGSEELRIRQALADVATISILRERAIRRGDMVNEQLQTALNSRIIIEQAKRSSPNEIGPA